MSRYFTVLPPSSSLLMLSLIFLILSRPGLGLLPRGKTPSSNTFVFGECLWISLTMALLPAAISSAELLPRLLVPIISISDLRLNTFQLAILQPPQDVLGAVAADAEVGGLERHELFLEDHGAVGPRVVALAAPGIRDRIAEEQHVDAAAFGHLDELVVPLHPVALPRHRHDGRVLLLLLAVCRQQTDAQHQHAAVQAHPVFADSWMFSLERFLV